MPPRRPAAGVISPHNTGLDPGATAHTYASSFLALHLRSRSLSRVRSPWYHVASGWYQGLDLTSRPGREGDSRVLDR
jgi:hypothetical protein